MKTFSKSLFCTALVLLVCTSKYCEASYVNTLGMMACVDTYIQLVRDGNWEKAYHKCYSQEYQNVVSYEEFDHFIRSYAPLRNNKSLELGRLGVIKGGIGVYDGIISSSEGERLLVRFELTKENGSWKIQQISLFKMDSNSNNKTEEDKKEKFKKYSQITPKRR